MSKTEIIVELATFLMLAGGLIFTVYEMHRLTDHDTKHTTPRPPEPVSKSASTLDAEDKPRLLGWKRRF